MENFELYAYSTIDRKDSYVHHFKELFNKWRSIKKINDKEVIDNICRDGIHILLDLQSHSAENRLSIFMYKPAPIQVSWLSQGSTGINEIDYLYVGLRIFNVVSFLLLFTYFSKIQDQNFINNFHKSMQIILLFLSSITIYIFVAQLFDLPEPIRNRANTSFFSNSKQSTFWLSQPHRAMGTFREPSFVVAFLFPLTYISILKNISLFRVSKR